MRLYTYDLETFPNIFLFAGKFEDDPQIYIFEISPRRNDRDALLAHLSYLQNLGIYMAGYNNLSFDYPIIHQLLNEPYTFDAAKAYHMAQQIIHTQSYGNNPNAIYHKDRIIPQIDWMKVNHFDNAMKRTSLKALQFAMRAESVEDLPFEVRDLTFEEMDVLRAYNVHDILETERFGQKCRHLVVMRKELLDNGVLSGDVLNYSDVKIGTEYLIRKIGRQKCFLSGSKPRQSFRNEVQFKNIILPKTSFRTERFNEVLEWFRNQKIYTASEERPKLEVSLAGLQFHFGVGGVHASVENKFFASDNDYIIKDIDVSGMYVAVAIANGFYPEHLSQDFVTAYRQLQRDRAQYPKGTTMNAVLKLAGNGVYGNSNNPYSCFFDPKYTFSVTVNGQLQLLQLAELLSLVPGLQLIQANTDGITAMVPRRVEHFFHLWKDHWESETGLKLEEVDYSKMFIRDVNNYIAVTTSGKIKRKGAYWYPVTEAEYEGVWNKDFSNLAAQKGVEQVLLTGCKPEEVVHLISNPFDFMLRYKTQGDAKVYIGDKEQLRTVRYYVSTKGEPMKKVSKPKGEIGAYKRKNAISDELYQRILREIPSGAWDERIHTKNKSRYEILETGIEKGWLVKQCNHIKDFDWANVDFRYYVEEIKKLIVGV